MCLDVFVWNLLVWNKISNMWNLRYPVIKIKVKKKCRVKSGGWRIKIPLREHNTTDGDVCDGILFAVALQNIKKKKNKKNEVSTALLLRGACSEARMNGRYSSNTRVLALISWTGLNEITESDALEKGRASYPTRPLSSDVLYFIVHSRLTPSVASKREEACKDRRGI